MNRFCLNLNSLQNVSAPPRSTIRVPWYRQLIINHQLSVLCARYTRELGALTESLALEKAACEQLRATVRQSSSDAVVCLTKEVSQSND